MPSAEPAPSVHTSHRHWLWRGALTAFSVPGLILSISFIGFAGLAADAGLTVGQAVFMSAIIWALPAQVVLIGAIMSGASLFTATLAVTLSSIRLMPMVIVLMPEMRAANTRRWVLYALSHFVAVTSWVLALERLRGVPRDMRTTFYAGLVLTLLVTNVLIVLGTYAVSDDLPPLVQASILLLTPMYFLTSLWASSRERASHFAMAIGIVLGPFFHVVAPDVDLLAGGIIGGLAAYGLHRLTKRRQAA